MDVETVYWNYELSGAFVMNGLTDPVFEVRDGKLEKNDEKRDFARLGVAAFASVYHSKVPWPALTFGIGINEGNTATYYIGGSFRFLGQAAISAGWAVGSRKRLPDGIRLNDEISDPNVLTNLDSRIDSTWFFAVSHTFLNPGQDSLAKPFARENE